MAETEIELVGSSGDVSQTLPCKAAHKLPCVLLPGLLVMGILAGI